MTVIPLLYLVALTSFAGLLTYLIRIPLPTHTLILCSGIGTSVAGLQQRDCLGFAPNSLLSREAFLCGIHPATSGSLHKAVANIQQYRNIASEKAYEYRPAQSIVRCYTPISVVKYFDRDLPQTL